MPFTVPNHRPAAGVCADCGRSFPLGTRGPLPARCPECRVRHHAYRTKLTNRIRRGNQPRPDVIKCQDCRALVGVRGEVGGVPQYCDLCGETRRRAAMAKADWRHHLKSRYGLTEEQHAELVARQFGRCAICHREGKRLALDHDHVTGALRGLLCSNCNTALGLLGEDEMTAYRASEYLRKGGVIDAFRDSA